ncbi:MAG: amidohydrolase family protein, partial [Firmicutes bacterium]|nr:amidohydrolase family protein [Bacillota bacterium]
MIALFNGKVYSNGDFQEAVITDGKYIKKIGKTKELEQYISEADTRIDLKGKVVIPGFIDPHAHGGSSVSLGMYTIDLSACDSVEAYVETIEMFISEHPDEEVYRGIGWQAPYFGEDGPEKEILDRICREKPVVLKAVEGHALWVNSKAIEMAGITSNTPDPNAGVIARNSDG